MLEFLLTSLRKRGKVTKVPSYYLLSGWEKWFTQRKTVLKCKNLILNFKLLCFLQALKNLLNFYLENSRLVPGGVEFPWARNHWPLTAAAAADVEIDEIDCIQRVHFPSNFEKNLENFQNIDLDLESGYRCCWSSGCCCTGLVGKPVGVLTGPLRQLDFDVGVEPSWT